MLCGALSGGTPFVARTETLKKIPLDKSLEETEAILISWFLRVKSLGLDLLLCPDMMHLVNSGGKWPPEISKETWRRILSKHGLQAVSTGKRGRPSVEYSFPCKEVKGSKKKLFMAVSHKKLQHKPGWPELQREGPPVLRPPPALVLPSFLRAHTGFSGASGAGDLSLFGVGNRRRKNQLKIEM